MIDGETKFVALLGYPVEHSRSPLIHNTAFDHDGLNVRYVAFSVRPQGLIKAVGGLAALGFLGANVTIPHKQEVRSLVHQLSETASAVGAVNTLVFRPDQSIFGDNTDVEGFLAPLAPRLDAIGSRPVTVLGSGGAARAVVYAIASRLPHVPIRLVARTRSRAEALLLDLKSTAGAHRLDAQVLAFEQAASSIRESGLIVNCTPVGMAPQVNASPWERSEDFGSGQVVYDLIYNPRRTRLLEIAARQGADTVDGLEMLIAQAAASYWQWTGREMRIDAVRAVLAS